MHTPAREPTPPHTAASDISRLYPPQHWSAAQASSPRSHHHSRGALSEPEAKAAVEAMQHGLDSVAEVASAPSLVRRHSSHATTLASPLHERLATQRQRRPQSSPGRRPRQSPVLQGEEQGDEPGSGTTPPQRRSRQRRPATATAAGPRGAPRLLLQRPYSPWSVRSERTTATAGQLTGSASFLRPASAGRHGSIRRLADDRDSVRLINVSCGAHLLMHWNFGILIQLCGVCLADCKCEPTMRQANVCVRRRCLGGVAGFHAATAAASHRRNRRCHAVGV